MSSSKSDVATSEEWLDKATKQKKQKVEWHNISVFGKLAVIVSSYCYKGSKVYVEGKMLRQPRKSQ
jgi:single-strand DNA-binding protein